MAGILLVWELAEVQHTLSWEGGQARPKEATECRLSRNPVTCFGT